MCRNLLFWATEYLNYFSLIFWGIKLFLKKYEVKTSRKAWVENLIIIAASVPVAWLCVFNYQFMNYSNFISYILILFMNLFIRMYTKCKAKKIFALVAIYIHGMRLIDLLVVAVVLEVNKVSRYYEWDLINMGFERSVFIFLLLICYYIIYRILVNSYLIEYLYDNMFYRWIMCIYSYLGISCFCRVYRFEYTEHLIQYWMFYLVFAFVMCGIFILYFVRIKNEEENRILNMRNDLLESNYQSLRKAYDENRMLYHDFKNHMLAVNQFIQENRNEEASEYIKTYIHCVLSISHRVESGCKIIDIIVNCKIAEALEKYIDFKYEVELIGEICIEDIDMCALLANLLDNAIEACEKIEKEKRWISLKIKRRNEMLFIWIENSISSGIVEQDKFFHTSKRKKNLHGLGMKSIDNVIQKYDGHKEYEIQKDEFQVYISIPLD